MKKLLTKRLPLFVLLFAMMIAGVLALAIAPAAVRGRGTDKPGQVYAAEGLTDADFLKVNGRDIKNRSGAGSNVYLRGTNAGGWLVHEPWMTPVNNGLDQRRIMETLKNRFGTNVRDELIAVYEDNFWTEADFDNCQAMGMSTIRLPFWYRNLVDDEHNLRPNAFKRLDWFVENCSKRGMYAILDMHGAFGSQNGQDHSGDVNDGWQLYNSDYNKNKTTWLWEKLAEHYKGNPAVAAYDLINEPGPKAGVTNKTQWDYYDVLYKAIRRIDPDHIIMMESCWTTYNLPHPSQYGWTNVMYQYHHYLWDKYKPEEEQDHINAVNGKISEARGNDHGVPIFVGEFTYFTHLKAWDHALKTYNNAGWHWTTWTYKVTGDQSWGIYNINRDEVDVNSDSADTIRYKWGAKVRTVQNKTQGAIKQIIENNTPHATAVNPFETKNLAKGKAATASSFETGDVGTFPAEKAVDGKTDANSRWASTANDNQWIAVDLGKDYMLYGTRLLWEAAYGKSYRIETATEAAPTNWQTVHSNNDGKGGTENIEIKNPVAARYVRMYGLTRATTYGFSLYEFEVYGHEIKSVSGTFNATEWAAKSSEIVNNVPETGRPYVGQLIPNSWLDYYINVPRSGKYSFNIRGAVGQAATRTLTLTAGTASLGTMNMVVNGADWFDFSDNKADFELQAGVQKLHMVANGSVNIEDITIAEVEFKILSIDKSPVPAKRVRTTYTAKVQGGKGSLKYNFYIFMGNKLTYFRKNLSVNSFSYVAPKSGNYSVLCICVDSTGKRVMLRDYFAVS